MQSGVPVTLRTAPDAVRYAGLGFLQAMLNEAGSSVPAAEFTCVIDCGEHAAHAHQALAAQGADIAFSGPRKVRLKLESIAAQTKTRLHASKAPGDALDLRDSNSPFTDCLHYLVQRRP